MRRYLTLAGCLSLVACALTDPSDRGHAGEALIIYHGDTTLVAAPDAVDKGVPFEVRFHTFGGGCVQEAARDDVTISATALEIRPYDHNTGGEVCTRDLRHINHVVTLTADASGTYDLRVIGLRRDVSTGSTDMAGQLSRSIVVR